MKSKRKSKLVNKRGSFSPDDGMKIKKLRLIKTSSGSFFCMKIQLSEQGSFDFVTQVRGAERKIRLPLRGKIEENDLK